jgi:hypothetical protein
MVNTTAAALKFPMKLLPGHDSSHSIRILNNDYDSIFQFCAGTDRGETLTRATLSYLRSMMGQRSLDYFPQHW